MLRIFPSRYNLPLHQSSLFLIQQTTLVDERVDCFESTLEPSTEGILDFVRHHGSIGGEQNGDCQYTFDTRI